MDLTLTGPEQALADECRSWLRTHLPWEYGRGRPPRFDDLAAEVAFGREWQHSLREGRWVGVAWPEEYGGRDAGPIGHYIVTEELASGPRAELVGRIGINLVGPTILAHGTEEQRARWLPRILSAEEIWCQLFSEPGAGSDLSSLSTRARRVDGGWVLDGQKVWTSYAQFADWGVCLARTDPDAAPSHGISYLVVDMRADGVEVRPLRQITDESEFNEVFFTEVFVPEDRIIGPEHEGWRIANSTLTHERGVNPRQLVIHGQLLDELLREAAVNGAWDDPRIAPRLAQAFVEVQVFRLHNWRSVSRTARGVAPGPVGSINKLWWSEMSKRLHDTVMAVLGPYAPLWGDARHNPVDGRWQRSWLYYQASSIWAGTNEIQRNVIGERTLGLPRAEGRHALITSRPRALPVGRSARFAGPGVVVDQTIRYEVEGAIATITLDRPDAANAQSSQLITELDAAFDRAEADEDVRVVVLGANGKHFSAGHDLKEILAGEEHWVAMRATPEGKLEHEQVMYWDKLVRIRDCPKITIAAVQGVCSAAGLMLAAMCDLIVAADDARFSNPVARMSGVGVELLIEPWELGPRRAKEFLLCATILDAAAAERIGLVNRVVPRADLAAEARAMAEAVALVPPITARAIKDTINHTVDGMGQRESWQYHFMVHQFVSNSAEATGRTEARRAGGMDAVKAEQAGESSR